jgi:four helix bundle protein
MISKVTDIDAYQMAYDFSMAIFTISKQFPKEEKYSLTDQITRSSRSICANIAEGWGKRTYENEFKKHLVYSLGSLEETKTWLRFALDCNYLAEEKYNELSIALNNIGGKIFKLLQNWKNF